MPQALTFKHITPAPREAQTILLCSEPYRSYCQSRERSALESKAVL